MRFAGVLVGGGLQSALIALAVLRRHPRASLALVERAPTLGGNHTWSFHAGDLSEEMAALVAPLVVQRWPGYEVAFPGLARRFAQPYASISSERLHLVVAGAFARAPHARLLTGTQASRIEARGVQLASGEWLEGAQVVDARGPGPTPASASVAYQKFVGLELQLEEAPRRELPCIMDARVPQLDGYRFVYTLPLAPDRWLVEDTRYSTSPALDEEQLAAQVLAYAQQQGARVRAVLRTERGVLPLPLEAARVTPRTGPLVAGYRGGWFHPTTGYSLPCAARLAQLLAGSWPQPPSARALAALVAEQERQARFCTLLNRLLFRACPPGERWRVLERFHRLPEATVGRFYALRTTGRDRLRILLGRPPQGIHYGKALAQLAGAAR